MKICCYKILFDSICIKLIHKLGKDSVVLIIECLVYVNCILPWQVLFIPFQLISVNFLTNGYTTQFYACDCTAFFTLLKYYIGEMFSLNLFFYYDKTVGFNLFNDMVYPKP